MKRFVLFVLAAFVACQMVPSSVMAVEFGLAPEVGASGNINGASASLTIPMNFSGRKIAEPVQMALNADAVYDSSKHYSHGMGYVPKRAITGDSLSDFVRLLESREDLRQAFSIALKAAGKEVPPEVVPDYIGLLPVKQVGRTFRARLGRNYSDMRNPAVITSVDLMFEDEIKAGELVLWDEQLGKEIVRLSCGNVIVAKIQPTVLAPVVVAPLPPPVAPMPTVWSVVIAPAEAPQQRQVAVYGALAPAELQLSPAAYVGMTPRHNHRVRNTVFVVVGVAVVAGVVYALTQKKGCDNDNDCDTRDIPDDPKKRPPPDDDDGKHPPEPPPAPLNLH